ncbi:MAG: UDP-3-O-(3-hydroxymyristoyl)glucosamine N-acyltransferase [Flavobacteriales bacterium]|nr:UDP-3-O-(3-hydroxymyristoyl)glucosamine N-acyltransferase [Flavobacteriales bacterium]
MKLHKPYSIGEISQLIGCKFIGDSNHIVSGINEIHMVERGDLVFVDHPKYYDKALNSAATTILIDKEVSCPEGKALIISEKPFDSYNFLTKHFSPLSGPENQENQLIDETAIIFPNVFIGKNVRIGKNTRIYSGVCLMDNTTIGDNVVIGANSVIGHFAFYYKKKPEGYDRMHTCGGVQIEDNVEIGALCSIDAGVSGITTIGKGSKLDDQVHIGHDTLVGENCLMAAGVGLAGCVRVENNVTLWGQVGIASNVTVGEGAIILAQSGVSKDLEGGKTYFGSPCGEVREKFKEMAALRMLPNFIKNK